MGATSSDLINIIDTVRNNPIAIQRAMLATLENITNGEVRVVDPSSPFVYLMEVAAATGAVQIAKAESIVHQLYPSAAQTYQDLYRHMADTDYLNRFSTPGLTHISLLFSYGELLNATVPDPLNPGVQRLTIPRQTQFDVAGYPFTMQYPVDIRVMPHGGLNVTFDTSSPSPLYPVTTNIIDWQFVYQGGKHVLITIPVYQMRMITATAALNNAIGFSKVFSYTDNFFYCRAYVQSTGGTGWTEIRATHTDQIYDPTTPTVVLQVLDGGVRVTVPQIYFNNGLVPDTVRIDIYTTTGPISVNLANYLPSAFSATWRDLDSVDNNRFSSPLDTFSSLAIFSTVSASGGTLGSTFAKLRNQVILGGDRSAGIPITAAQVSTLLGDNGYALVTDVDNITDRQFLATRTIPAPADGSTITGVGCTVQMYQNTLTDLSEMATVFDGNSRITILPSTLYRNVGGVLTVVPDTLVQQYLNPNITSPNALANIVNNNQFLFSPFHYVLDVSTSEFKCRPFRLDAPTITSKYFVESNASSQIAVASIDQVIRPSLDGSGYTLSIQLQTPITGANSNTPVDVNGIANPALQWMDFPIDQTLVQLSFVEPRSTNRYWIEGELISQIDPQTHRPVNGIYLYSFDIPTGFDIDQDNNLIVAGTGVPIPLTTTFDLVYLVKNYLPDGTVYGDIDEIVNASEFSTYDPTAAYLGVSHESVTVRFGEALEHLWTRARSVAAPLRYKKYLANVPAVYTKDVYLTNSNGNIEIGYDDIENEVTYTLLHAQGDPVLVGGVPQMLHLAGDNILDSLGQPIPVNAERDIMRQMDLFLMDGNYYFANDPISVSNLVEATGLITNWVTQDLPEFQKSLLERTTLSYYPMSGVGTSKVIVDDGISATVPTAQSFIVTYFVPRTTNKNEELRKSITSATIQTIADVLAASATISLDDISTALKVRMGSDINAVSISGFMEDEFNVVTVADQSVQPTIGKQLAVLSNLELQVQDAVTVVFKVH